MQHDVLPGLAPQRGGWWWCYGLLAAFRLAGLAAPILLAAPGLAGLAAPLAWRPAMRPLLLSALIACSAAQPWLNPALPVDQRVTLLLAVMTNEEKQAQTIHLTGGDLPDVTARFAATGLGAYPQEGSAGLDVIGKRNAIQGALMNNSRLHIPVSFHEETLHGANAGTIFPMPASQGASWNAPLVRQIAAVIALEASATGTDRGFSPELNVPQDGRFGRTEENFSEDPALVSQLGVAAVLGLHAGSTGGPSSYLPEGAIASEAKHYAVRVALHDPPSSP